MYFPSALQSDGTVNYTYTVTDAGTTGATVEDNAVTVTAAGTAKVKVTATLASDATKTSTKEITLTVTTNKASAEDKAKLAAEIASVKDLKEADYTEESYADLKNALAKAVDQVAEALGDEGRILVRESGTEPLIRVMVEAAEDALCEKYVDQVVDVMKAQGLVVE